MENILEELEEKDPFYGAIAEQSKETDYQLGGDLNLPKAKKQFSNDKIQYNQKEVSAYSCTVHAAMGAYSDLTGYVFPLEERKALWKKAIQLGADPNVGWYINSAVDLVRKPDVYSFRVEVGSDNFFKALDNGYSAVAGFRGNKAYENDKNLDGILDKITFGKTTYGHSIRIVQSEQDVFDLVVDNYKGITFNVYKINRENFKKLIANGVFFVSAYVYVDKAEFDGMNEAEKTVPIWATGSYDKAIKKGVISYTDSSKLFQPVMDSKVEDTLIKAGVFTQKEGNVTLLRWIVALDRLKALE